MQAEFITYILCGCGGAISAVPYLCTLLLATSCAEAPCFTHLQDTLNNFLDLGHVMFHHIRAAHIKLL